MPGIRFTRPGHRRLAPAAAVFAGMALVLTVGGPSSAAPQGRSPRPWFAEHKIAVAKEKAQRMAGLTTDARDEGGESEDIMEQADQYAEARTSPGVVAPGAYGAAWAQLRSMASTGGGWGHVTGLPYDADDPRYRDINSNSSGGAGRVTGRMTGMAADNAGNVYAGGADGGVFRSTVGGGHWTSIADALPTLSTGDLQLDPAGRLWYATGEANTGATAFVGTGVYVLADPRHHTFGPGNRVGGAELESTTINALRFAAGTVWAATSRGVWTHSTSTLSGPWHLEFAPNPDYLPGGPLDADPNAPYKNITSDIAIARNDPTKVMLAVGWRSGDDYNGFYRKVGGAWQRVTSLGDLPTDPMNVGNVTFARSADGSRYYAIDQSPDQLANNPDSNLKGIYVSKSGSPFGPWTLIADYQKLAVAGSALNQPGFKPGVQAWYNQFLQVDPTNPDHVYAGLEEVFETSDGGTNWITPGPYWNFFFPCWNIDPSKQTGDCHQTIHPDQHSVAVGTYHGKRYLYVGDDGGLYRRPVAGHVDADGHGTDWLPLNDGTLDTLQYYSVGIGRDRGGVAVTGGLQDNGQSILRPGDRVMGSNFGGDGGDSFADPGKGCNIAQEYVFLAIAVTNNCAVNDGAWVDDPSKATSYNVPPPDSADGLARFIAPFSYDPKKVSRWVAGGQHVWVQNHGFGIRSGDEWTSVYDLGDGHVASAVAVSGGTAYVGWCGPCNNQGFTRGIAVGRTDGTGWHQLNLPIDGTVPNRYVSGLAIDPHNGSHVYAAINGFSRKWTEGPGAGIGHIFESRDAGAHWRDLSANLPDVPANSVVLLPNGGLALGTDLAVFYRPANANNWKVLGRGLPTTAVLQLRTGPNGTLYAATHGRGIRSFNLNNL